MEILQEGANHFRLDSTFVETKLFNIEIIARKPLNELKTIKLPEGPLPAWTFEMMQEKDEGSKEIIFLALNNKILRFDLNNITENTTHFIRQNRGTHFGFQIASKYWYEPKYGVPKQVEDMQEEVHRYVEDMVVESVLIGEVSRRWTIVAILKK
jgi:hypothetical protein